MSKAEEHDCAAKIWRDRRWSPCSRAGRYEHEGRWYCKQHHPETDAKREEERERESNERLAKWDRKWKRIALLDKLEALAIECYTGRTPPDTDAVINKVGGLGRQLAELQEKNHVDEI